MIEPKMCEKCGKPTRGQKWCFNCTIDELTRLREQGERIDKLLSDNPEIMELLDKMTAKQIINKLKGRETVTFT
jgi:hypothetical protein